MRKSEEERGAGAEKKAVRRTEWGEESAVFVRVASKGVSGNWACAREGVSTGRLEESGELTTKEEYHRSYGKVKRKCWSRGARFDVSRPSTHAFSSARNGRAG